LLARARLLHVTYSVDLVLGDLYLVQGGDTVLQSEYEPEGSV
jgi:hypothetical protein